VAPASSDGVLLSQEQLDLFGEIEARDNIFAEIDHTIYRAESIGKLS
jgi:hypothetical protein